jgi:uncharacterized protein (TIGR03083 family)
VERTHSRSWGMSAPAQAPVPALATYDAGVEAVCQIAELFNDVTWSAQTPCPEWRAFEVAGHLRCVADDFNEYLDEAPVSRYARLMATGAHPDTLGRKLARQNAAELAALADAPPAEHIAAFAWSARSYGHRLTAVWDLPHHQYRDTVVTVGGMAGAASAEWHLHAWDLARALGTDYRPANPAAVLAGWRAGMPHLPVPSASLGARAVRHYDPWHAVLAVSGRLTVGTGAGPAEARVLRSSLVAWPARLRRRRRD